MKRPTFILQVLLIVVLSLTFSKGYGQRPIEAQRRKDIDTNKVPDSIITEFQIRAEKAEKTDKKVQEIDSIIKAGKEIAFYHLGIHDVFTNLQQYIIDTTKWRLLKVVQAQAGIDSIWNERTNSLISYNPQDTLFTHYYFLDD